MTTTIQAFLAESTQKASTDILAVLLRLPEDKRNWSPGGTARTALDIVAECALNNRYGADLIKTHKWTMNDQDAYRQEKADLVASGLESLEKLLEENTKYLIEAIEGVADDQLDVEVPTPFGNGPLSGIMRYPYWNMSYHEGQLNSIDMLLGN